MRQLSFVLVMLFWGFVVLTGCDSRTSETEPAIEPAKKEVATSARPVAGSAKKGVVTGKVVNIDSSAMVTDGDGILHVSSNAGRNLTILIPSGESQPQATGLDLFSTLKEGDTVEIMGEVVGAEKFRVYQASHYIKRVVP